MITGFNQEKIESAIRKAHENEDSRKGHRRQLSAQMQDIVDYLEKLHTRMSRAIDIRRIHEYLRYVDKLDYKCKSFYADYVDYYEERTSCLGKDGDEQAFFDDRALVDKIRKVVNGMSKEYRNARRTMHEEADYVKACKAMEDALHKVTTTLEKVSAKQMALEDFVERRNVTDRQAIGALYGHWEKATRPVGSYIGSGKSTFSNIVVSRLLNMGRKSEFEEYVTKAKEHVDPSWYVQARQQWERYEYSQFVERMMKVTRNSHTELDLAHNLLDMNAHNSYITDVFGMMYQYLVKSEPSRRGRRSFQNTFHGDVGKFYQLLRDAYEAYTHESLPWSPKAVAPTLIKKGRKCKALTEKIQQNTDYILAILYGMLGEGLSGLLSSIWETILSHLPADFVLSYRRAVERLNEHLADDCNNVSAAFRNCKNFVSGWLKASATATEFAL